MAVTPSNRARVVGRSAMNSRGYSEVFSGSPEGDMPAGGLPSFGEARFAMQVDTSKNIGNEYLLIATRWLNIA